MIRNPVLAAERDAERARRKAERVALYGVSVEGMRMDCRPAVGADQSRCDFYCDAAAAVIIRCDYADGAEQENAACPEHHESWHSSEGGDCRAWAE